MRVTFWGVRGSMPTPHPRTLKYGGNTPCVEIETPQGHTIILDCGTGITHLGKLLAEKTPPKGLHLMVFLTHFHWDHIQGLPFFTPLYDPRTQVFFHCFEAHGLTAKDALGGLMLTPFFPVNMSMMKGSKNFYIIGEERLKVFDVEISSRYLNHPQGCLGYRVESETGVFVYATDHEHGNATHDASIRKLAQGADILVYDGQYTPAEYQTHVGWGHSTWEEGIQVAQDADVKELVLFHHDPDHSDLFVDKMLLEARACFPHVHAAIEGTTVNFERQERGGSFRGRMEQRYSQRVPLEHPIRVSLQRVGQTEGEKTTLGDLSLDGSFFLVGHDWDMHHRFGVVVLVGTHRHLLRARNVVHHLHGASRSAVPVAWVSRTFTTSPLRFSISTCPA